MDPQPPDVAFDDLFESAPDATLIVAADGRIVRANRRAADMFGCDAGSLVGRAVESLLPARLASAHRDHFRRYFADPRPRRMGSGLALLGRRADGEEFPVEIALSPVQGSGGAHAVAAIRDVSSRRAAETEIARREREYRTLVANLPGTVYRCRHDENWTMRFVSRGVEQLTGYPPSDFIDNRVRTFESIIHPDDRSKVASRVAAAVAERTPWSLRYRIIRSDGTTRWAGERGRAVFGDDGDVESLDGVIADISAQVELEEQLRVARVDADRANHAKSDFLSSMSHELRTPLNGILGYAQILQRDPAISGNQRSSVDSIVSCGDHLLSLINDVLDLSKIEAGRVDVDPGPCDLVRLARELEAMIGQRAREKGLAFRTEVGPEVPRGLVTDTSKLRQALVNLLGNAVKFTSTGSVTLRIRTSPGRRLAFEVVDTGVGIADEEQEAIFDPFKQVEAGKAAGGTGLGLAISRRLTRMLGGDIEVESRPGEGSCFRLTLPCEEADEEDFGAIDAGEARSLADAALAPGQDCSILVADDRPTNRDILRHMLEDAGFRVTLADDGDTALEELRGGRFDLALLDVRMPRLNGIDTVAAIREDPDLRDLPVIAVTASVFPDFRERAIAAGFDDFLGKPFRISELMRRLQHHLDLHWETGTAPDAEPPSGNDDGEDAPGPGAEALEALRAALRIRNITALQKLAASWQEEPATRAAGREVARLAGAFDFPGLAALEKRLSSNPDGR